MTISLRISSGSVTDRGLSEKRPENEDSYLEAPDFGIFAVADGVGGAEAGDVASQMAMEILAEAFRNRQPGTDAESVMLSAIEKANSAIHQMSRDLPQLSSMATTVVALHLNGNIATIGHVGDSRLYRVDPEGNFYRETEDHSMVADEVRAGRMTELQAENHPARNIINRALGAEESVIVDLKTMMIDGGTAFLLCSDGITRHVTDQEIKGVLTFGGSPADICGYLKDLCYSRGAEDNLTAVVVKTAAASAGEAAAANGPAHGFLSPIELEEPTLTTARPRPAPVANLEPDANDLLELTTDEPPVIQQASVDPRPDEQSVAAETLADAGSTAEGKERDGAGPALDAAETGERETIFRIEPPEPSYDNRELFGASATRRPKRGMPKALSAVALLLTGAVLGIGAYYFVMSPQPVDTDGPQLTEMRAANIPLSAFEENRRNVDENPAAYIARYGTDPRDCEDHYLLGRAYLLTGDYTNARANLIIARNRLSEADPTNAPVLANDIAIAISVINGTTAQNMLRKELDATRPGSHSADNGNASSQ